MEVLGIYDELNNNCIKVYERSLNRIREIQHKTNEDEIYNKFFNNTSSLILKYAEINKRGISYFDNDINRLKRDNESFYEEILPCNYENSYANPEYSVSVFGDNIGQLLSSFYLEYRNYIDYAFKNKIYKMKEYNDLFIKAYDYVNKNINNIDYYEFRKVITQIKKVNKQRDYEIRLKERFGNTKLNEIVEKSDLSDIKYVYKYGISINENDIKNAKFILGLPQDTIKEVSSTVVNAFLQGFITSGKDRGDRNVARVVYNVGEERIVKQMIEDFKVHNISLILTEPVSVEINRQYSYDHRFDETLYVNKQYLDVSAASYEKAAENCKDVLEKVCGVIYFDRFGEPSFAPKDKKECLKLTSIQTKYMQDFENKTSLVIEKHVPDKNRSFCIIAFPTPEIGENFEKIYQDTLKINTLDSSLYERIHQTIINTLDKGDYVHVKGKGNNKTDIKVKLHEIQNPEKETVFENCCADVNIPVGEVFTSPILKGTNGILHLEKIFLNGLEYKDLIIKFKDGYTEEYNCKNFDDEDKNKKYIEENLLFPHKKLPIGEFAIGTNTLAYVIANKYNIVDILPILIVEKMGPHFAIGDTCFSHSEDVPTYNSNGKRMIAVENEKSINRKTDINKAYTNVHTDITIPYDDIANISVITKDKQTIDIIKNARFVLEGTEELNEPFK